MRATFNSIEYSESDVPNIIPKGTEMLPRKSIVQANAEQGPAIAAIPGPTQQPLGRSKSVHVTKSNSGGGGGPSSPAGPPVYPIMGRKLKEPKDGDDDEEEDEEDEFFDCREDLDDTSSLAKWSSMDLPEYDENDGSGKGSQEVQLRSPADKSGSSDQLLEPSASTRSSEPHVTFRRVQSMRETPRPRTVGVGPPYSASPQLPLHSLATSSARPVIDVAAVEAGSHVCPTTVLILVAHGGSVLDMDMEVSVRKSDVTTFRGAFESVMRTHYPWMVGHVVIKCVPCPAVCSEALAVLSSLSPYR